MISGCTLLQSLDELSAGSSAIPGTGGSGSGGAGAVSSDCSMASDCAPHPSQCVERECVEGACAYNAAAALQPVASQTPGDCRSVVCDGSGNEDFVTTVADLPDDGNPCTEDVCVDGVPDNVPLLGADCPAGVCDAAGDCVECVDAGDCAASDAICLEGQCVPATCVDDVENGDETDLDCGGSCPGCATGDSCLVGGDCAEGVCNAELLCAAPSCDDDVANGSETDVDCGGMCPKCADDKSCNTATDCTSGVCFGGVCQKPECDDNVLNGTETAIDCGGATCGGCGPGQDCKGSTDCLDTLLCLNGKCADPCKDGVRNFQETGVDCGGPLCGLCPNGQGCATNADCASTQCCTGSTPPICVPKNSPCPVTVAD